MLKEYTMQDLLNSLQAVRGEKAVKSQELPIRKEYIQAAVDEVFSENDFYFNRRVTGVDDLLEYDENDLGYEVPDNFSIENDYSVRDVVSNRVYHKGEIDLRFDDDGGIILVVPNTTNLLELTYHIVAPILESADDTATEDTPIVRFPQGYLLAERAYVRLKVAYMPDENSDSEYKRSRMQCRLLAGRNEPRKNFTPGRR